MKPEVTNWRILPNEQENEHDLAVAEVKEIRDHHHTDPAYVFEYQGQPVAARFVDACLETNYYPANAYRIQLAVPVDTLVIGECQITDTNGQKIAGHALTIRSNDENSVFIRTLAEKCVAQESRQYLKLKGKNECRLKFKRHFQWLRLW